MSQRARRRCSFFLLFFLLFSPLPLERRPMLVPHARSSRRLTTGGTSTGTTRTTCAWGSSTWRTEAVRAQRQGRLAPDAQQHCANPKLAPCTGYYDKTGKPTEALKTVWRRIDQQRKVDAENAELAAKFPNCNSQCVGRAATLRAQEWCCCLTRRFVHCAPCAFLPTAGSRTKAGRSGARTAACPDWYVSLAHFHLTMP